MNNTVDMSGVIAVMKNTTQAINALNQTLNNLLPIGAYIPFPQSDASAPNNSLYYSTTTNKLTYKDPSGSTHTLY